MITKLKTVAVFFSVITLTGCSSTFAGSLFLFTFRDMIFYVIIALILAAIIALVKPGDKRTAFWLWFILSLILTPLAGLIYLLILLTRKKKD